MIEFIKKILNRFVGDSAYKKNILLLSGGRIVAQLIPILITPIITRVYSPEEFGLFAVFLTIVSFIAMISNGRYCLAILLPKKKINAQKLVLISMFFTSVISFLFVILVFIFKNQFFSLLNIEKLNQHLLLFLLTILFLGLHEALYYYFLRDKQYKKLAKFAIVQAIVMITIRLLLGFTGNTQTGLMVSYLSGYFINTVLLIFNLDFKLNIKFSFGDFKKVFIRYISFLKYSLFSDSLSVLASTSPNVFLNNLFGNTSAGYFSLSEKVLGSPIWFITSSVSDVFKQEFSEQNRERKDCKILFFKTFKTLLFVGLIPFTLIFLFIPYVISPLFGEIWNPVGEYIRIFSIMYYSSFVVSPLKSVAYLINKQQYMIFFELLKLIALIIAFSVGFYLKDIKIVLILWSLLITIVNIIVFFIIYRLVANISNERKNPKGTTSN